MQYLKFLGSLLKDAGEAALDFPQRMPSQVKGSDANQVVTAADLYIGSQIKRHIVKHFPQDSVIDEESGVTAGPSPITWVIDPIDGTSNFAVGSPLFGVMVGVLEHGNPVAGGVALPALAEIYVAEAGQGAYRNGERLRIPSDCDFSQQLIAYGMDIHPQEISLDCGLIAGIASRCRGIRMSNSIFDCMMVAKGAYGAFMHRRNGIWDCVAAQVVIEEAGGVFSTMDGSALDYGNPLAETSGSFSILACAPSLHEAITEMTRKHLLA
ncbi:inositol monophosphatase family protein [Streptomyces sp. Agncl-13]|uniref:inositol monophosphatase family protein n=1 Tax=Streptomyces sp. Agncl-13 TaxID=3400628 RepID=UPI003A8B3E47